MFVSTYSAASNGISGVVVEIEAASQKAVPRIVLTGLPGDVIKESVERVRACLCGLGFEVPSSRIVVNLSPASAKKQGPQCDVAIAVAVLQAEGFLHGSLRGPTAFLGELNLDGRVQPIQSAVLLLQALETDERVKSILLPRANGWEAELIESKKAKLVDNLAQILDYLRGELELDPPGGAAPPPRKKITSPSVDGVIGHPLAKRALQIALAGRHHLLLIGSPGVGKSLLASCAPALLPPLTTAEWIDVVRNYSYFPGQLPPDKTAPFRSPHHGVSSAGLLGGGSGVVIPGEVTLAHHGVLFLDEFPEYRRDALEGLREPLQNGRVQIHRIGAAMELPAAFTLIAAMNPCPCGHRLSKARRCRCPHDRVRQYQKRISGPILDRIDLCLVLGFPQETPGPSGEALRAGILRAREGQLRRGEALAFSTAGEAAWAELGKKEPWSMRALQKIARVARTIADLEGNPEIEPSHVHEARALRCPDSSLPDFT